jgi:hypothetical protein
LGGSYAGKIGLSGRLSDVATVRFIVSVRQDQGLSYNAMGASAETSLNARTAPARIETEGPKAAVPATHPFVFASNSA